MFDCLLLFYIFLEDEDKFFYCFVVIILDYFESFVNMVFGNFFGFFKEDESIWWMLVWLLKLVCGNGFNDFEDC